MKENDLDASNLVSEFLDKHLYITNEFYELMNTCFINYKGYEIIRNDMEDKFDRIDVKLFFKDPTKDVQQTIYIDEKSAIFYPNPSKYGELRTFAFELTNNSEDSYGPLFDPQSNVSGLYLINWITLKKEKSSSDWWNHPNENKIVKIHSFLLGKFDVKKLIEDECKKNYPETSYNNFEDIIDYFKEDSKDKRVDLVGDYNSDRENSISIINPRIDGTSILIGTDILRKISLAEITSYEDQPPKCFFLKA